MRIIECDQYSEAWWQSRRGVPTASEFGNIITPAKGEASKSMYPYACRLIADLYRPDYGLAEEYVTGAMRNGTLMEPEARKWYAFETGSDVRQVGFCLTDDGRFGCSPDALVGEDGALELKCPEPHTHVGYLLGGVLPNDYKPQVHGHLIVTGCAWCDFMSYSPGLPPFRKRVVPDEFTESLRARLDEFWTLYQETKAKMPEPPPEPELVEVLTDASHPW